MLGTDGEDWHTVRGDPRLSSHAENGIRSQKIFEASNIEKYIKTVESLKSGATLAKIWAEIDRVALKKTKNRIEKVLFWILRSGDY